MFSTCNVETPNFQGCAIKSADLSDALQKFSNPILMHGHLGVPSMRAPPHHRFGTSKAKRATIFGVK
jgi:hypothetical protein